MKDIDFDAADDTDKMVRDGVNGLVREQVSGEVLPRGCRLLFNDHNSFAKKETTVFNSQKDGNLLQTSASSTFDHISSSLHRAFEKPNPEADVGEKNVARRRTSRATTRSTIASRASVRGSSPSKKSQNKNPPWIR